jgi:hypothetical protein
VPDITAAVYGVYAEDPNDFANEGGRSWRRR